MIKLKDLIVEKTTKRGFEVIDKITNGKPKNFGRQTKASWVQHHETGIMFGGGGKWKNDIFVTQIFTKGNDKYRVEFLKSMADQFGLSGTNKKRKIWKKLTVKGDMLYSALKQHLGI